MTSNSLCRLFVGSLPYNLTEGQLLELFAPYGRIVSLMIIRRFGKSKGTGFVEFDDPDSALKAKNDLNGHFIFDRTIIVDFAKPDPLNTPEGLARHQQSLSRRQHSDNPATAGLKFSSPRHNSKYGGKLPGKVKSRSGFQHVRQSVYDSRRFGARVGAKFSRRAKKS